MRDIRRMVRRGAALMAAAVLIASMALIAAACGSGSEGSGSGSGSAQSGSGTGAESGQTESGGEDETQDSGPQYNTTTAAVTGKCYVLTAMSSEDEDFDDELIKEMFDIKEVGDYMQIYFEKGGTAYVYSLVYGKEVQKGQWGEDEDGITILAVNEDGYEIEQDKDGGISTTSYEEDGEGFLLVFHEPKEVPEKLKEYVKK